MKTAISILTIAATAAVLTGTARTPAYKGTSLPIEQRVEDALSRMTIQEKINLIHVQSKFSSRGVPRLGIPDLWSEHIPHAGERPQLRIYGRGSISRLEMVVPYIKGLQSNGVAACVKHFALNNNEVN